MPAALDGLLMIDCTEVLAGPFCSMLLADMGVEAIKVERPGTGDNQRGNGPHINGFPYPFTMVNRNKRSITVNLKRPEGQTIIHRLAERADIFLENFRPGTMEENGLGYETLRAINPRLIYASVSGFGQTGPYRERGGFDLIAQGMSGLMSVTGEPGRPPAKSGYPVTDLGAGLFCAYGILTALLAREKTGRGQRVDTSLFEAGIAFAVWQTAKYLGTGEPPGPMGSAHPLSAPYQAFRTADGYLIVGAGSQALFKRLCATLERDELVEDARFATPPARMENTALLAEELERSFTTRPAAEWMERLTAAGIPCGPIYDVAQMLEDPQARAREMVVEVEHPVAGPITTIGNPVKLSDTPWSYRTPAPVLGADTDAILRSLGYDEQTIERYRDEGII
jgi:crotonobetainyl-CoA:carnitine CoA-transferase CaiB-like acyl-CoA transferase